MPRTSGRTRATTAVDRVDASPHNHRVLGDIVATSEAPYMETPAKTIVLTCSDGRFSLEEDEMLRTLGVMEHPDRIVTPGGPGAVHVLSSQTHGQREATLRDLAFLITHHATERVLLVSHAQCGHYGAKYSQLDESRRLVRQLDDMEDVAAELRKAYPRVRFDCYYALPEGDRVVIRLVRA